MRDDPLLGKICDLAGYTGWRWTHHRPARTGKGYRTPISGDAGFPDIALARDGLAWFLEVKPEGGYPTEGQVGWLRHLPDSFLVRPSNFEGIRQAMNLRCVDFLRADCTLRYDGRAWVGPLSGWVAKKYPRRI